MTFQELHNTVREFGLTFVNHYAKTGSQYITIEGQTFRFSDHEQPSHYRYRNYIDVASYDEIVEKIKHLKREMTREQFIKLYTDGGAYNGITFSEDVEIVDGEEIKVWNNGYGNFTSVATAASNLYYNLFVI